jgi:hypothetical protein
MISIPNRAIDTGSGRALNRNVSGARQLDQLAQPLIARAFGDNDFGRYSTAVAEDFQERVNSVEQFLTG